MESLEIGLVLALLTVSGVGIAMHGVVGVALLRTLGAALSRALTRGAQSQV